MKINRKIATIFAIVMAVPTVAFCQSFSGKTLLSLGNEKITAKEFMEVYEKNNVKSEVIEKKNVDEYLDLYINFKLKVLEAEAFSMDTSAKFKKELTNYRQQLAKPYFSNDEISAQMVREAYERMQTDINAAHILIKCDRHATPADTLKAYNKAIKIRSRILKGEDFGEVAAEVSDDPSARDIKEIPGKQKARKGNRGDLGYFSAFDMVYPFETGAYNTKVGEVSMPVRSDFGYHLIKVNSKTPALGLISAAHIFLIVDPNDPNKQDSIVREKINNIYKELEPDGSNWDVLVNKYTDDRGTVANRGTLSTFRVSNIVPEFIAAVKELQPGEIHAPIHTNYGYHIVKFISNKAPGTFEAEEAKLKERVEKDMRSNMSEAIVLKRLMKDNKFKEISKTKDAFIATFDSTLIEGNYQPAASVNTANALFKIGKQPYAISNFIAYIEKNQKKQSFLNPQAYGYQLYDEYVKEAVFAYEDANLENKYPDFKILVDEYHDGILLFDLMEKQVWNKAAQDTVNLMAFYEKNTDKYQWNKRVKVLVATAFRPDNLGVLREMVDKDMTVEEMRDIIKSDTIRYVSVKSRYYQKGDDMDIDSLEWTVGNKVEIPSSVDKSTRIIKVLEVRQPEPKTFKEAKGLVISDYQTELEKTWLEQLRQKYPVAIDEAVLEKVRVHYQ